MKPFLPLVGLGLCIAQVAAADTYTITVTNRMSDELLAPIAVTSAVNDPALFDGPYVTQAAETQILTGDPSAVVASIGAVGVVHGNDGPPGVLLAPGDSVTFDYETDATALRILAMVAPTMLPDTYVAGIADLQAADGVTLILDRFDIGNDEGTHVRTQIAEGAAQIQITRH
ncbi:hypothetical protein [Phaeobacter gallaeciensis]|uniref:hypothetical protein n=1 Tax=Phaeobacter gallaeciensis TaxID=60890 RepID=UPI00237FB1AB|nr:hypothetical protein [Phaeobacter gallaeciensis]MDE4061913.1 hypothetical protein [Phaeobacter gallaeciensis]MDE4124899.1 hypothetical protein [Phaeobacter gallaeciensis]MDE4129371.1 hypothetical protein [Phaeobacter gallaeciensis]